MAYPTHGNEFHERDSWKRPCRAATTANITIATALNNGDVLDGVTLATGDRVLVKDQSTGSQNAIYCLDDKTEILTADGWRGYEAVRKGDLVLTLNIESGRTEWQPALEIHAFDVNDIEMLAMEGPGHSSLSTLNHRWPTRRFRRITEQGKRRQSGSYITVRESADLGIRDSLIAAAPCDTLPTDATYSDPFVELVAWFVTEGHIRINNSGSPSTVVRIVQSARVNEPYVERIRASLMAMAGAPTEVMKRPRGGAWKAEWHERSNSNGHGLTTFELNSVMGAMLCRVAPNRVASAEFIGALTHDQLRIFVNTIIAADGHTRDATGQQTIGQNSLVRLAPMQMACTLLGIATTIAKAPSRDGIWTMYLRRGAYTQPHLSGSRVRFTGTVWCPRTPNGTWVARRNGTVYMTGNTVGASPARAVDFASSAEIVGAVIAVLEGTANADTGWICSTDAPITVGTTAITFAAFGGGGGGGTPILSDVLVAGNDVSTNDIIFDDGAVSANSTLHIRKDIQLEAETPGVGDDGGNIDLQAGAGDFDGTDASSGGEVFLTGGQASGQGGMVEIYPGWAKPGSGGDGGDLVMIAGGGDGAGRAGQITMPSLPASDPAVAGAVYNDRGLPTLSAPVGTAARKLAAIVAQAAIANTETVVASYSMPANAMAAGTTFRIRAYGRITSGATPGSSIFRCRIGTTTLTGNIPATLTIANAALVTNAPFVLDILVTVRTAGAGGTVIGNVSVNGGVVGAFTVVGDVSAISATVAVDTTAAKLVELTYISGNAGTTARFENVSLELL